MKFKYIVRKFFESKTSYLFFVIMAILIVIISSSYAIFTSTSESKGALNIITGELHSNLESMDLDNQNKIIVIPNEIKIIDIKVKNPNTINSKFNLYYSTDKVNPNIEIGYLASSEVVPANTGFVINKDAAKLVKVMIKNNDSENVTITFGSDAGLENATLDFPTDKLVLNNIDNKAIEKVYTYNQTTGASDYCVTGDEATCVETECYKTKTAGSCPAGTIIKYKVNDEATETFHVMYDRANSITMQTQKNTVYNTAWYSSADDNTKGPLTILPALESATADWTNVEDQTYTMGTTNFPIGDEGQFPSANSGTSCTETSCSGNKYTLATRTAKARMITIQETAMLGCTDIQQSCPNWMNNYLYQSTNYGGTVDDNEVRNGNNNWGYWTMSACSSDANGARFVVRSGNVRNDGTNRTYIGARAVVVVSK